jgi:glycerol-3-phosphate dehydrogenase
MVQKKNIYYTSNIRIHFFSIKGCFKLTALGVAKYQYLILYVEMGGTNMSFSSLERGSMIDLLENVEHDLLIIGGGITGAGIALDAASRGMKTALVEMQDFAAGTSSRSTKLIHGGLRYLKQLEIKMVAEVGKERAIVYENGPHVTTPIRMILPIYKEGSLGKFSTSMGLRVYDYLAGVKKCERRTILSREEVLNKVPLLKEEGLIGGGYYVEYRTDDARLTIEVLKKSIEYGAKAINYTKVVELLYENGKVIGVKTNDQLTGKEYNIYAKKVVNATGPWVDSIRKIDHSKEGKYLSLTKGTHLVFDQKIFPLSQAIYFDTEDGRMVFAIPRHGKVYVGTTDTVYQGDTANPKVTARDRDYIIHAINYMFPNLDIAVNDIESSWAGLRPLIAQKGKSPSEISRKDEIWESESGLITIAGGKLTGYRKMAEMIVDFVNTKFQEERYKLFSRSQTKDIPISGGDIGKGTRFEDFVKEKVKMGKELGLSGEEAEFLSNRYGSNVDHLYELIVASLKEAETYEIPPVILGQIKYSIVEEMTVKPVDFFIRRTGALYFEIDWVFQWKNKIIHWMSKQLKWSNEELEKYKFELESELKAAANAIEDLSDASHLTKV